jgi:hypothetical protein
VLIILGGAVFALRNQGQRVAAPASNATPTANFTTVTSNTSATQTSGVAAANPITAETPTNEVNTSVVVTHDLDFGPRIPSVAEAMRDIERRCQPEDGKGRTFAILEAFSQGQPEGKLRLSLRISTEKTGIGEIIFRRTGEPLWKSRIVPATHKTSEFTGGSLTVLFDNGAGKTFTVDGSNNPQSILDAMLKEPGVLVAQAWPDGEERELSFIYSACGCPIKVLNRRVGERTVRVKESQVIFPDDPAAIQLISRLMRW